MARPDVLPGLIVRAQSGFFTVQTESALVTCQLRGRLKKGRRTGDIAAVGDRVQVSVLTGGAGMIEDIEERDRAIVRLDPRPQGIYQQILLANPDQVLFVFACAHPSPHLRMLDRFLVVAEKQRVPAVIVANKIDLLGRTQAESLFGLYTSLGYPVLYASSYTGEGVEELRSLLTGRISALAGPSGVGKSSLLNVMQPGLGLEVREISQADKGSHTTVVRQLLSLDGGGYVADTPGWKSLALWDTEPEELDAYFPELAPLVAHCQYNNCTHKGHEPGCAVHAAVEAGTVHRERYESYLRLRAGYDD
jgi:ribosome biogenesis GTPase